MGDRAARTVDIENDAGYGFVEGTESGVAMRSSRVLTCVFSSWLAMAAGCSSSSAGPGAQDSGAPETSLGSDSGTSETGTEAGVDSGAPETGSDGGDATACSSVLPEFVTTSLTLTKACSPYSAPLPVFVGDATKHPILTIEPGVTVAFASGAYLSIGMDQDTTAPGGLQAVGTAASPIVLTSSASSPSAGAWGGVYFNPTADATSTLSYATVSYAGQQFTPLLNTPVDLGSIYVDAGTQSPLASSTPLHLLLSNLTISHNGGSGIVFFGPYAGFTASSGQLTIPDWATGGYPIVIDGNSCDTIPTTLTTGSSGHDGGIGLVQEEQNTVGGGQLIIVHNETWPSLPIPYIFDASQFGQVGGCGIFVDGVSGQSTPNTLTIAAPNTIEFTKPTGGGSCGLVIQTNAPGPVTIGGRLIANGTTSAQIVFTSAQATPAPGDWGGIEIDSDPAAAGAFGTTSLSYCTISYAANPGSAYADGAALFMNGAAATPGTCATFPQGPSVTHCTFSHYATGGIVAVDVTDYPGPYGGTANANVFMPATGNTRTTCDGDTCGNLCN